MSGSPKLALYYYDTCGYCRRVDRVIRELGLEVERRHIYRDRAYLKELVEARGRRTTPVLRIEQDGGQVEWMPESRDIIRYLYELAASIPLQDASGG